VVAKIAHREACVYSGARGSKSATMRVIHRVRETNLAVAAADARRHTCNALHHCRPAAVTRGKGGARGVAGSKRQCGSCRHV